MRSERHGGYGRAHDLRRAAQRGRRVARPQPAPRPPPSMGCPALGRATAARRPHRRACPAPRARWPAARFEVWPYGSTTRRRCRAPARHRRQGQARRRAERPRRRRPCSHADPQAPKALRELRQAVRSRAAGPPPGSLQRHGLPRSSRRRRAGARRSRRSHADVARRERGGTEGVLDVGRLFARTSTSRSRLRSSSRRRARHRPRPLRETASRSSARSPISSARPQGQRRGARRGQRADEGDMAEVTKAYEARRASGLRRRAAARAAAAAAVPAHHGAGARGDRPLLWRNDFNLQLMATCPR